MKFVKDWRQVLDRAWSVRLMVLAVLLSGVEVLAPLLGNMLEAGQTAALTALVTICACVARILAQREFEHGA